MFLTGLCDCVDLLAPMVLVLVDRAGVVRASFWYSLGCCSVKAASNASLRRLEGDEARGVASGSASEEGEEFVLCGGEEKPRV